MPDHIFERHQDDEYIDQIVMKNRRGAAVEIKTVYRFKSSGMSGDEWRTTAAIHFLRDGEQKCVETMSRVEHAVTALPWFWLSHGYLIDPEVEEPGEEDETTLNFKRKGHLLWEKLYPALPFAVLAIGYDFLTALEGDNWHQIPDKVANSLCFQPGCAEKATVMYRLKRQYAYHTSYVIPDKERYCKDGRRAFCQRHAHRGDCGLEDADDNYELIVGSIDPTDATVRPEDIRKSLVIS